MKRDELASLLGVQDVYLQKHWQKAKQNLEKRDIYIYKIGREPNANYGIKLPWLTDTCWDLDELEMI